jgi:hypothetical protein
VATRDDRRGVKSIEELAGRFPHERRHLLELLRGSTLSQGITGDESDPDLSMTETVDQFQALTHIVEKVNNGSEIANSPEDIVIYSLGVLTVRLRQVSVPRSDHQKGRRAFERPPTWLPTMTASDTSPANGQDADESRDNTVQLTDLILHGKIPGGIVYGVDAETADIHVDHCTDDSGQPPYVLLTVELNTDEGAWSVTIQLPATVAHNAGKSLKAVASDEDTREDPEAPLPVAISASGSVGPSQINHGVDGGELSIYHGTETSQLVIEASQHGRQLGLIANAEFNSCQQLGEKLRKARLSVVIRMFEKEKRRRNEQK